MCVGEGWTCLASGSGPVGLPIAARGTSLHAADLATGQRVGLPEAPRLHVFVARGRVMLGERLLGPGDAARLVDEGGRQVRAEQDAQLAVWAFTTRR